MCILDIVQRPYYVPLDSGRGGRSMIGFGSTYSMYRLFKNVSDGPSDQHRPQLGVDIQRRYSIYDGAERRGEAGVLSAS